jgi:hypothetical protein
MPTVRSAVGFYKDLFKKDDKLCELQKKDDKLWKDEELIFLSQCTAGR